MNTLSTITGHYNKGLAEHASKGPVQADRDSRKPISLQEIDGGRHFDVSVGDEVTVSRSDISEGFLKDIKKRIIGSVVPGGYPDSVSSDYMAYRKWSLLQDVGTYAITYFNTQLMLAALGISFPVPAIAAMAWTLKEGSQGVGKFIGSYLAHKVDQDPKKWNKIGNAISNAGTVVADSLAFVPGAFGPLAPLSQIIKATGDTIIGAAGVNIGKHLAKADNLGEVQAKNANQDMIIGTLGTGLAVGLQMAAASTGIGAAGLAAIYVGVAAASFLASYKATGALKMEYPTENKLMRLFEEHCNTGKMMSPDELGKKTSIRDSLSDTLFKDVKLGAGFREFAVKNPDDARELLSMFRGRNYILFREKGKTDIALCRDAKAEDVAEAMYVAARIESELEKTSGCKDDKKAEIEIIRRSLDSVPSGKSLVALLGKAGWDTGRIPLPVGKRVAWNSSSDNGQKARIGLERAA
jgi:hypothetical protein